MSSSPSSLAKVLPLPGGSPPLESRTDDELVLLARAGRAEAFDALVRRHQGPALQLAFRYLGDTASAKDACQSAFLEVYRSLSRYRPTGSFVFYLRRIVLNQCRMVRRRARSTVRALALEGGTPPGPALLADDALIERERQRELQRAVGELSTKLREVVSLRYAGGHSLDETAAILQLPLGTVKSRLFAAIDKLKDLLGDSR